MKSASKNVLIVEDEKPMAHALELKLNNSGFVAKAVYDGQEALDILEKEKFDLIISDLMMPVMDGFELLKQLKEKSIKIPVIIASNLGQQEDIDRAKGLGAKDYFIKSDTPIAEVVEKVKAFI